MPVKTRPAPSSIPSRLPTVIMRAFRPRRPPRRSNRVRHIRLRHIRQPHFPTGRRHQTSIFPDAYQTSIFSGTARSRAACGPTSPTPARFDGRRTIASRTIARRPSRARRYQTSIFPSHIRHPCFPAHGAVTCRLCPTSPRPARFDGGRALAPARGDPTIAGASPLLLDERSRPLSSRLDG